VATQNDFRNVSDVRSLFELTLLRLASEGEDEEIIIPAKSAPKAKIAREKPVEVKEAPVEPVSIEAQPVETKPIEAKPIEAKPAAPEPIKEEAKDPVKEAIASPSVAPLSPDGKSFTEPPAFLFEDAPKEQPAPEEEKKPEPKPTKKAESKSEIPAETPANSLDTSKILKPAIATTGEEFTLSDDEIMKIFVLSSREERSVLAKKWTSLDGLRGDPKLGNLATLLAEGHPFSVCKEAVVLTYDFTRLKKKANIKANQEQLSQLLAELLGRRVFVYGVDPSDRSRLITLFNNLNQVGQLPKKDCVLNLPK
jgi:hypothetical protein